MKHFYLLTAFIALLTCSQYKASATTYNITSNKNWTAVVGPTNCWTCTFNITPGVTFNINYAATCGTCTFNDGNLNVSQNLTCQGCTFTTDTINAGGTTLSLQSPATTFTNTFLTMNGTGEMYITASSISITNSNFVFSNSAWFYSDGGTVTVSNSTLTFDGNSYFYANAGPINLENNTNMVAGDGTIGSKAYLYFNGPTLNIYDNSLVKVSNQNNYYFNWGSYTYYPTHGASTTISTSSSNINCNHGAVTGYANSCTMPYVYGCGTLNSGGLSACTLLAIADLSVTAREDGPGQIALTWTDNQNTPADHYTVQRSTGDDTWTSIGTVAAHTYLSDEYQFADANAPAGTVYYRIERTDANNSTTYSSISTISISPANTTVGIHPNPAAGGLFYLSTASTEPVIVNVFTTTGQLLLHTALQGQTQYPIRLPAQGLALSAVIVQTISGNTTRAFTELVR